MMTDLSVCIVTWRTRDLLERCLRSVLDAGADLALEVIVVDNDSRDGSEELVRSGFPSVKLVVNRKNRGFATANNQALEMASGRYLLLLNPDTEVRPAALAGMVRFMDGHPEAGAMGPKLLNADGSLQPSARRFPTFRMAFQRYTFLGRLGLFRKETDRHRMEDFAFDRPREVDQPSGAALLVRREVLERKGFLDEGYFMFYEEVDLCRRIRDAGWTIHFFPGAEVVHHGGASRHQALPLCFAASQRSLLYYFSKHRSPIAVRLFRWSYKPLFLVDVTWEIFTDSVHALRGRLRGDRRKEEKRRSKARMRADFLKRDLWNFLFRW